MNHEPMQLVVQGHMITVGLVPCPVDGNVHVAQCFPAGPGTVVQVERQHVRRAIQLAILVIQLPDIGVIDQYHGHGRMVSAFAPKYPANSTAKRLARYIERGQGRFDINIQGESG